MRRSDASSSLRRVLQRDAMTSTLRGLEPLERRQVMAILAAADAPVPAPVPLSIVSPSAFVATAAAPTIEKPTGVRVSYATGKEGTGTNAVEWTSADALSFQFGDTPQAGDTWCVLENGVPVAVNTRYYKGLGRDSWETTLDAVPFDFTGKMTWEGAANPVILPTAVSTLRSNTVGDRYEVRVTRGAASATSAPTYGRFIGDVNQTGSVGLLDLDYGGQSPAGVAVMRGTPTEQVAAIVVDAGKKISLRIGELGDRKNFTSDRTIVPATLAVEANRPGIVTATVTAIAGSHEWSLTIDTAALAGKGGMVSLRIVNTNPGTDGTAPRYLGVIVKDSTGKVPSQPSYLSVGAVNTNDTDAQMFFRGTAAGETTGFPSFDTQYVYLNDGPLMRPTAPVTASSPLEANPSAWRTASGGVDGKKLIQSLRESAKFGAVPQIVYYNLMAPNESQEIALANLQNRPFLVEYFKDLKFTLDTIRTFAAGTTVSLMLEPDLLAYMMQSAYDSVSKTYREPSTIVAMTDAAYEAGLLPDPGVGSRLPNTLPGFIEAINRGVRNLSTQTVGSVTQSVNLQFGWKFNLWATVLPIGGSVVKLTDADKLGWAAGRDKIAQAAAATADWYTKAGILTGDAGKTMDFIALDKYGTDGGATGSSYLQTGTGYKDPDKSVFFWNADHWNNYLLFAKTLHDSLGSRPVRLWQLPVGHVNGSDYLVNGQKVADLANIDKQWEDSAVSYFLGDNFSGVSNGRDAAGSKKYFSKNDAKDPLVSQDADGTIVWGSHMGAARDAGIESIMFGPGLANSTQGGGYRGPALDGYFWASKVKDYLKNPVPLQSGAISTVKLTAQGSSTVRVANGSIPAATVTVERTGDLSSPLSLPVTVVGGTADAGSDYRKAVLQKLRVTFAAGQSSALLIVPTLPTTSAQPKETLKLQVGGLQAGQPVVTTRLVLSDTSQAATTLATSTAAVARAVNEIRAIETFSNPDNPGQIVAQLRANDYPDPNAPNRIGEVSGTNGLSAYAGDARNTPGAYQVDLANLGIKDPNNPARETFGEWRGTAQSAKGASPYDTQIAFSKATLSEFFGIEVDAAGLITRIPAAAAAVFGYDEAMAASLTTAWDPTSNALIGQHIDNFQIEQLRLYLAGRSPLDGSTGVADPRTTPQAVMDLAAGIQQQVAKSLMYSMFQKFQVHDTYKETFAEVQKYFGATLKIKASQSAFGIAAGERFWGRMNGSFIVGGTYVRGEGTMADILKTFVEAAKTGTGVWVVDPSDPTQNVTITRVTPAGTVGKEAVFAIDKTPVNVSDDYPSVFHYGAVMSAQDDGIDWNDKAAWGVTGRNVDAGLGYARAAAPQAVTGPTVISQPGRYVYSGLAAGGTLTLTGAGPFVIVGASAATTGPKLTTAGYPLGPNNDQSVAYGQKIDVSAYGMTTSKQVLDASFYSWYGGVDGTQQMARVDDPSVPTGKVLFLYFVPAAAGNPAAALANQGSFYDSGSPYYQSARVKVDSVSILGRAATADAWAKNFVLATPAPGTGVIDASQVTGSLLIAVDDTIATVKLGRGRTAVIGYNTNLGAKTYVLNAQPLTGSSFRPVIDLKPGDAIDARLVPGSLTWVIDDREQTTFDNNAAAGTPYRRYTAFSRYLAKNATGTTIAAFSAMVRSTTAIDDPAAVVKAALLR